MEFFKPDAHVNVTRHKLPHWQQDGCAFAVTFRLADSLPKEKLDLLRCERERWMLRNPRPWTEEAEAEYVARFTQRVQRWLDAGHGSCVLRVPKIARIVAEVLHAKDGPDHALWAWVVMPNHVHVLAGVAAPLTLSMTLKRWKGASAREINRARQAMGRLWQPDYFDRLVRSRAHFEMCLNYIRDNPDKARLKEGQFLRWERPGVRELLKSESGE
jgi:REP element-mobilizing transposase RayT